MVINPVRFPYTPDVTVVNQRQFDAHYKLYEGYVNSINDITSELNDIDDQCLQTSNTTNGYFRGLKRGESYAINGVILHELYFRNIGGRNTNPTRELMQLITDYFGSIHEWEENFIATGMASRGWTVLCYEQRTKSLRNISYDLHDSGGVVLELPLLVLDVYEHAYFMQYGTKKREYIEAFMRNIHWDIVKQRYYLWKLERIPPQEGKCL